MKNILPAALVVSALFFSSQRVADAQTKPGSAISAQEQDKPGVIALKSGKPAGLAYDAGTIRILASSEDTRGAWSLVELKQMPGYHTNFHRHNHTDEAFYVLEGVLTVKMPEGTSDYPAGSYVLIPRGTPHAQGNRGKVPVRVLLTMTPGGFEQSFLDRVSLFKTVKPGDPDFRRMPDELTKNSKVDVERLALWDSQK
jgi:quercetin dioxygenase-like cupin family protein